MRGRRTRSALPKKVEYIFVHIDAETTPDPGKCLLCDSAMDRVLLSYEFQDQPRMVVRNSEPVPGYRCRSCDAEYYDGWVSLALFQETLTKLESTSPLRIALTERIARLTEALGKPRP